MKQHYPLDPVTGIENPALAWANGNPSTGTNGSYPSFGLFLDPQKEILAAQRAGGLTDSADGSDTAQLSQSISRGTWLGVLSQPATVNDLTAALPGSITWPALIIGMEFSGVVSAPNAGPMTVTLTGFGTLPGKLNLVGTSGNALAAGDIVANVPFKFRFDGTQFRFNAAAKSERIGRLLNVQAFSTAGTYTYTPTPGTISIRVRVLGGGGAGGGAVATSGQNMSLGAPGGAGAYAIARILSGFAGIPFVVGAAGQPVSGGTGGNGGTSSVGSFVASPGGIGGGVAQPSPSGIGIGGQQSAAPTFGAGAIVEISAAGAPGGTSQGINASNGAFGAQGGASVYGGGGPSINSNVNGIGSNAAGSGGGGSATTNGYTSNVLGGPGSPGNVVFEEYA